MDPAAPTAGPKSRVWLWLLLMIPLVVFIGGAVVVAELSQRTRYFPVTSGAMEPTLLGHDQGPATDGRIETGAVRDRIAVDCDAYRSQAPNRGDIIVFNAPKGADMFSILQGKPPHETVLVKRVIGIPGDTIELKSGAVYRNGEKLEEFRNPKFPYSIQEPMNEEIEPQFRFGVPCSESAAATCGPARIGPGQLWVMGDNRNDSNDGRYWGTLDVSGVIGKVTDIVAPEDRKRKFD